MFILVPIFLVSHFDLTRGESNPAELLAGKRPGSKDSVLETCQALHDAAQLIRLEGYTAIDKAELIRDQAYRVKDEAYEIKDEAYEIKESVLEARTQHETTLIETLGLIHQQALATSLYIDEIRNTLGSVLSRIDSLEERFQGTQDELSKVKQGMEGLSNDISEVKEGLEGIDGELDEVKQGLEELGQSVDDGISGLSEAVSDKLTKLEKLQTQKLIPAARVAQSTTYSDGSGPEKAVDGNYNSQSHTNAGQPRQWFRYYFSDKRSVGLIKVVNGKLNSNRVRLNGAKVSVMVNESVRRSCREDTITVRDGETIQSQTYYLDCSGNSGIGVEFVLDTGTYLEFRQIEVYAP